MRWHKSIKSKFILKKRIYKIKFISFYSVFIFLLSFCIYCHLNIFFSSKISFLLHYLNNFFFERNSPIIMSNSKRKKFIKKNIHSTNITEFTLNSSWMFVPREKRFNLNKSWIQTERKVQKIFISNDTTDIHTIGTILFL